MHPHGLQSDLEQLLRTQARRRQALRWLAAGSTAAGLQACGGGGGDDSAAGASSSASSGSGSSSTTPVTTTPVTTSPITTTTPASCSVIPEETAGPYPGDGSNSSNGAIANALALSGIVRSDIRSSIAGATGVAAGVQLTVRLQLVNTGNSCAALSGHAVYLWHCDAAGRYSMYSPGVTAENYLRGVQASGSDGMVTFVTTFPGCYSGRMPHIHFEVYRTLASATQAANKIKTSQIALPVAACQTVYASAGYSASVANLAAISFASDNVFSDGVTTQLATLSGDNTNGWVADLVVGVAG